MPQSLSFNWFTGENTKACNKNQMHYKLHTTNWIQQNLGDVSACFFLSLIFFGGQCNNLVKIEAAFFQFPATNEKYTAQHKKTMWSHSIETHTHTKKTTNIHTQTQQKLYNDTHTQIIYPNTKLNRHTCWNPRVLIHRNRASALPQHLERALKWQAEALKYASVVSFTINNLIFACFCPFKKQSRD